MLKTVFEFEKEVAQIVEEILKQRLQGIKNEKGVYITPAFPKLIYVLDENNIREDSKYYYLTKLAAKCTAKRMYPDYISAKKMKEHYGKAMFSDLWDADLFWFLLRTKTEIINLKDVSIQELSV